MITKGEIQSIDYTGNTCVVRLPYFESAGLTDRIFAEATISNQPGMYNGYKAGDVVFVAFDDGEADQPVVLGKLYLGATKEQKDPRGVMNAESSIISSNMSLPLSTKLVYDTDESTAQNGQTRYDSIADIANRLATITAQQDKTLYDMTGVITTSNMLKSEISAVKAGSGNRNTYSQDTAPKDKTYSAVDDATQGALTELSNYVGYYILKGDEYVLVTDENKEKLDIRPLYTKAYKMQKLEDGDIWIYTGDDLYTKSAAAETTWLEANMASLSNIKDYLNYYVDFNGEKTLVTEENKEDLNIIAKAYLDTAGKWHDQTKVYYVNLLGKYVYCDSTAKISDSAPVMVYCPACGEQNCYQAADGNKFILIDATNCDPNSADNTIKITKDTNAYELHLVKNQSFYWKADDDGNGSWQKGEDDRWERYSSSITQTAEQLKTEYSRTNDRMEQYNSSITQTANDITLAVSKSVNNSNNSTNYASDKQPSTYTKVDEAVSGILATLDDYVGYYILKDNKYELVTDENKSELDIQCGATDIYTKLKNNDTWLYTGETLYEQKDISDKKKTNDYIGSYVYVDDNGKATTDSPKSIACPECGKTYYGNESDHSFILITVDNRDTTNIEPEKTTCYKVHLANNTYFYYKDEKWIKGTQSTIAEMSSAITQTASSIDAKVSKKYNDGSTTDFGWSILQSDESTTEEGGPDYKKGDKDGKFIVYSAIKKSGTTETEKTDVLHANKNGLWVKGNLEVEDADGQAIFRALPNGTYTEDKTDVITYDGTPRVEIGGFTVEKTTLKNNDIGFTVGTEGLSIDNKNQDADINATNQFAVLANGSVWGRHLYIEQTNKHDESQTASSYFDGNVCGHQMKVDTVELATTNTGDGTDQTDGFRHEFYEVTASEIKDNSFSLTFCLSDLKDSRDSNGNEAVSAGAVWAVLSNKTIGVSLRLVLCTDESDDTKTKSVTFSTASTLRGYPYKADGSCSNIQKQFNSDNKQSVKLITISISNEHHLQQTKYVISSNNATGESSNDYNEGSATEITELSGITCYKIKKVEILAITPKEEEYFTGDFYASSGFFKNKYGAFSLGMCTDVFSLPWMRLDSKKNSRPVPVQILKRTYKNNNAEVTKYYAYKELRKGDYCTITAENTLDYCNCMHTKSLLTKLYYTYGGTYSEQTKSCMYMITDAKISESADMTVNATANPDPMEGNKIIPGLENFTTLETVNVAVIRKYLRVSAKEGESLSLGDDWADQTAVKVVDGADIGLLDDYRNVTHYHISVNSYGTNIWSTPIKLIWPYMYDYNAKGVTISFVVDEVGTHITDSGVEVDKIYVFCPRSSCTIYNTKQDESDTSKYLWVKSRDIDPMTSDSLSLMLYGTNNKIEANSTGAISSLAVRYSGAYLASTGAVINKNVSDAGVMGWTTQLSAATNWGNFTDINASIAKIDSDVYKPGDLRPTTGGATHKIIV